MNSRKVGSTLVIATILGAIAVGLASPAEADHLIATDGLVDSRCDNHSCTKVRIDEEFPNGVLNNGKNVLDTIEVPGNAGLGKPDRLTWGGRSVCVEDFVAPGCAAGGDITGVFAGFGLTGGATFGNATLNVDTATIQARIAASCVAGSTIAAINVDGTVLCDMDDINGGNAQLLDNLDSADFQRRVAASCAVGSSIRVVNADGTVACETDDDALNGLACGSDAVPKWTGTAWACGSDTIDGGNANLLDGLDSAAFQRRVSGACAVGSSIRVVNADGTVGCEGDDIDGGNANLLDGLDSSQLLRNDQSGTLSGNMVVTGNVGIGTAGPVDRLQISGTGVNQAIFVTRTDGASSYLQSSDGGTALGNLGGALSLQPGNSVAMTLLASGNVGIGTASPGQKLTVAGTVESTSGGFKFPDGSVQTAAATGVANPVGSTTSGKRVVGGTTTGTTDTSADLIISTGLSTVTGFSANLDLNSNGGVVTIRSISGGSVTIHSEPVGQGNPNSRSITVYWMAFGT